MSISEERILGSYRLVERIGRGGMGEVYRAQHLKLGREAAVKVLPINLAGEADFLTRFEREAASAASLDHPNILPVWEYGEHNGMPYLVMPLVRGGTLKERLEQGPLPRQELTNYLGQMAEALDYAHEQGIVHRDVKPANMLIDGRGRVFLSDFGIAKALEGAEGLTRTGVGVGTPEYMAPEQAQGRADTRSDLYALGIVLYQMLTGRVPYSGNSTVEVLMKHLQEPLPLLPLRSVAPGLPPGMEGVVRKALAKNPNERYQTGHALVEAVNETLAGRPAAGAADATVLGNTPPPAGATPPPGGPRTGDATVLGGGATPGWQQQPTDGPTPPPGWQQGGGGYTPPPQPTPAPQPRGNRRPLLFGGLAALVLALLLCGGVSAVALSRNTSNNNATATAQAQATGTAQLVAFATGTAGAAATATAGAPTVTPVPPTATPVPPTATTAPTAAPTATPASVPTATPRPQQPTATPATAAQPQPNGQVPQGWRIYRGTTATLPIVVAYPPDWTVEEQRGEVEFSSPDGTANLSFTSNGRQNPSGNIDALRDNYWKAVSQICRASGIEGTAYETWSGLQFAQLNATCDYEGTLLRFFVGAALNRSVEWDFLFVSEERGFIANRDRYLAPMLRSLNIVGNP